MTGFQAFWHIFGDVLVALWFGFTVLAAVVGVWTLVTPTTFIKFNKRLSVWITLGKDRQRQRKSITIERPFYRYHIATGLMLIAASAFVLYEVVFNLNSGVLERALKVDSSVVNLWIGILIDAAIGWIYISGAVALIIGIIVTIRPSYLKGIEQRLNYWVETEEIGHSLDKKHELLDEWVIAHPRIFGILSLLGSVIVAWSLIYFDFLG